MSKSPSVTVRVPKRSAFDKSHKNRLTGKCGTLVPLLCDEVIPGTKVNLRMALACSLPPLVSDTYMNVSYKVEAFFCPSRLLFGGFEDWFTQDAAPSISATNAGSPGSVVSNVPQLPLWQLDLTDPDNRAALGAGTLADYLGCRISNVNGTGDTGFLINPLPFLAYHMIWEHWYRCPLVQQHAFAMPSGKGPQIISGTAFLPAMLPYIHDGYTIYNTVDTSMNNESYLADSFSLEELRQRNFGFDYFTNAFPNASQPSMTVAASGSFTIASLRASNSLQQFAELNQLAGKRLVDVCKARYGANLNSGVAQRPVFLGSASYEVYSRGVNVTGSNESQGLPINPNNPLGSGAGMRVGNAFGSGSDYLIRGFECNEPGYIMVIGSLVPRACYGTGIRRYLKRYLYGGSSSIAEMATPLLQNVGNDPIYGYELSDKDVLDMITSVFGYTDKFASWFNYEDEVHGLFRDGESLEHFVLQRDFTSSGVYQSSYFLEIPTTFMDGVTVVANAVSDYGYQLDVDFDYKVLMPMYPYSRPSLQDPAYEHGRPVTVNRGGFRF